MREKVKREETGGEEGQEENATPMGPQQLKDKNALSAMGDVLGVL